MAQLCIWTKIHTKEWLVLGSSAFQCKRAGFLCPKCDNFACLHTRQNQNELHVKRWFFLPKSASSVSRSQTHLVNRKRSGWSIGFNSEPIELYMASHQGLCTKFVSMMSPKCSIVKNDGELMLMALHTHVSATAAIFSGVCTVFWLFTLWFIDEDVSFFHIFHKITNIRCWRSFSSTKILAIFHSVV